MLTDARLALLVGCLGTLSLLALSERFVLLLEAAIAFLVAYVVIGRRHHGDTAGAQALHPAVHDDTL